MNVQKNMKLLILGASGLVALAAQAQNGACVYDQGAGGTNSIIKVCEDNLTPGQCRNKGISSVHLPGKTCAQLKKNNSYSNVSMQQSMGQIAALVAERGEARVEVSFHGTDTFTSPDLNGTQVDYEGGGHLVFSRAERGMKVRSGEDLQIRLTGYRASEALRGDVAERLVRAARSARIASSAMNGEISMIRGAGREGVMKMEVNQKRVLTAQGADGFILSEGSATVNSAARQFTYKGEGFTFHPVISRRGELENGRGGIEVPGVIRIPVGEMPGFDGIIGGDEVIRPIEPVDSL